MAGCFVMARSRTDRQEHQPTAQPRGTARGKRQMLSRYKVDTIEFYVKTREDIKSDAPQVTVRRALPQGGQ